MTPPPSDPAPVRVPGDPPLPAGLHARPAGSGDAAGVLALIAACDRTYRDWAPAGWRPPEVSPEWPARLVEPGRWSLVACREDGLTMAYVAFRPARRGETPGAAGGPSLSGVAHVAALYVHPSRWREGIGAAMLARAQAAMRARDYAAAQLWTPAGAPAERFYAACGWRRDGRSAWDGWLGLDMVGYATRL